MPSTVVSIMPCAVDEEKPGLFPNRYHIAESKNYIPEVLHIQEVFHYVYIDETRGTMRVPDPSDEVAASVVNDYCNSQLGRAIDAKPGLFWVPGTLSSKEILENHSGKILVAKQLQKQWFVNITSIAKNDWNERKKHNVVSSFQRKVAELLGLSPKENEWMTPHTVLTASPCPACGVSNVQGVVICTNCKCVLDKEKYKDLVFA